MNANNSTAQEAAVPPRKNRFLIPTAFFALGGYGKLILPRLDALFHGHYGDRPDPLALALFDFDEGDSTISVDGRTFSVRPYLNALPRRPFLDVARAVRRKNAKRLAAIQHLRPYVLFDHVRAVEGPGMNHIPQNANLAYRLVWASHVRPELDRSLRRLNPTPRALERLSRDGITVSNRSMIWVIAGGASTTGPAGLFPILADLKRLKPRQTTLYAIVFAPNSYRDKSAEHKVRGRAIFRASLTQLSRIYEEGGFRQPYDADGYDLTLEEEPFDQIFLVDGSLGGGKSQVKTEDLAELVARFLLKVAVGPLGERMLGRIADFNPTFNPRNGHTREEVNPDANGGSHEEQQVHTEASR